MHHTTTSCTTTRRAAVLERCLKRLEWDKVRAKEAQEAADAAERERLAMMSVSDLT